MRHTSLSRPVAIAARLPLVPRLRADETLSSWLERFAGSYAMRVGEFTEWLGRPRSQPYQGLSRVDLDRNLPADLAQALSRVSGLSVQRIEQHRLLAASALSPHLRRTFCPECWAQERPYRRREWASSWSLVCTRHRRLLSERAPAGPSLKGSSAESWLEFYEARSLWEDRASAWQGGDWRRICWVLGLEPRTGFLRTWSWLRNFGTLIVQPSGPEASDSADGPSRPQCVATNLVGPSNADRDPSWRVKRDLVLYALLRFRERALLQALDETIPSSQLLEECGSGELCTMEVPDARYHTRLFAAVVAQHLWERLTDLRWRRARVPKLEGFLSAQRRWHDEEWWLERRLRTWPPELQAAGRQLLHREDTWVLEPPWARCRDICLRRVSGLVCGTRGMHLPSHWHCRASESEDHALAMGARPASAHGIVEHVVH